MIPKFMVVTSSRGRATRGQIELSGLSLMWTPELNCTAAPEPSLNQVMLLDLAQPRRSACLTSCGSWRTSATASATLPTSWSTSSKSNSRETSSVLADISPNFMIETLWLRVVINSLIFDLVASCLLQHFPDQEDRRTLHYCFHAFPRFHAFHSYIF